jgi:hypothetical protein
MERFSLKTITEVIGNRCTGAGAEIHRLYNSWTRNDLVSYQRAIEALRKEGLSTKLMDSYAAEEVSEKEDVTSNNRPLLAYIKRFFER